MPKVSVVMPTWNAGAYLHEALASTLGQSLGDIEVLVIDSVSSDNTIEVVESFRDSRLRLIRLDQMELPALKRNIGFREASGQYIALMDADDIMEQNRLEVQAEFMDSHPDIHLSGSSFIIFNESGEEERVQPTSDGAIKSKLLLANGSAFHGPTMVLRRDFLLENDLFFPDLPTDEDHALWVACMEAGARFANIDQFLLRYRKHATSHTATHAKEYAKGKTRIRTDLIKKFFPELPTQSCRTIARTIGRKRHMRPLEVLKAVEAFKALDDSSDPLFGADRETLNSILERGRLHVESSFQKLQDTTSSDVLKRLQSLVVESRPQRTKKDRSLLRRGRTAQQTYH